MKQVPIIVILSLLLAASSANAHWAKACIADGQSYTHGKRPNGQVCHCEPNYSRDESRYEPPRGWDCEWK